MGLLQISAAAKAHVRGHVGLAGLAGGRGEVQVLVGGADDVGVGHGSGEEAVDQVGEGRDAVHEDPEPGQGGRGGKNAAEDQRQGEEQVRHVATRLGRLDARDHHVGEGRGEEEEGQEQEEHEDAPLVHGVRRLCVAVQADRVVPGHEDDERHERVPG